MIEVIRPGPLATVQDLGRPAFGHLGVPRSGAAVRVLAGPRDDWFAAGAIDLLCGADYLVTPASDRTGLRLDGPALPRAITRELASEGMFTGALQIPRRQADPAARRPPRHRRLSGDRRRPVRGHRQGRAVAAWPASAVQAQSLLS